MVPPTSIPGPRFRWFTPRRRRALAAALTAGIVIGIVGSNLMILPEVRNQWGEDYRFFVRAADHWLTTGQFYLPHQLAGPYVATTAIDVLYPPVALALFVPFVYLPAPLWWLIPLSIIAWSIVRQRPAYWTWPLIALLAWLPRDESIVIWGNTSMWIAAFVALAVRFRWVSVLVLIKPTFAPFAVIGIRSRAWWLALVVVGVLSLLGLNLWFDYLTAMRNNVSSWPGPLYSVPDFLFVSIPLVAWLGRTVDRPG